jgi:hypothetical protein
MFDDLGRVQAQVFAPEIRIDLNPSGRVLGKSHWKRDNGQAKRARWQDEACRLSDEIEAGRRVQVGVERPGQACQIGSDRNRVL